ncbi:MAG: hypothetical protein WCO52_05015 [bacterium]
MVTAELAEYVRQQLAAGHSKEGLRSLLVTNGWQEADVREALDQIAPSAPKVPMTGQTKFLLILLLIVAVGGALYWYFVIRPETLGTTAQTTISTPVAKAAATASPAQSLTLTQGVITIVGDTGLQATYTGMQGAAYAIDISSPQNTVCPTQTLSLVTTATYTCGSQSEKFDLQAAQSSDTVATVAVTNVAVATTE